MKLQKKIQITTSFTEISFVIINLTTVNFTKSEPLTS